MERTEMYQNKAVVEKTEIRLSKYVEKIDEVEWYTTKIKAIGAIPEFVYKDGVQYMHMGRSFDCDTDSFFELYSQWG